MDENEVVYANVIEKCKQKYAGFSIANIMRSNPTPSTFGYSYELPKERQHENENRVKATKVGTFAEINAAIEEAKIADKKAVSERYKKYRMAEGAIDTFMMQRMAEEFGYKADSKVFAEIYSLGYEDGHADGWSDILYHVEKYANLISKVADITGTNLKVWLERLLINLSSLFYIIIIYRAIIFI